MRPAVTHQLVRMGCKRRIPVANARLQVVRPAPRGVGDTAKTAARVGNWVYVENRGYYRKTVPGCQGIARPQMPVCPCLTRRRVQPNLHPPTQEATAVKLWRNAERVSSEALAKEDMLRRVPPMIQ